MKLSALATLASELIDVLEKDYEDTDVEVGVVAIVVEVTAPDEDGDLATAIWYRCSEERRWIQAGLFEAARRAALRAPPGEE